MKIVFTKGSSPLSEAIRGVTKEPVSHVALDFGLFIVHSNLLGVNLEWFNFFKTKCTIVYTLERTEIEVLQEMKDAAKLDRVLVKLEGAWYDFGALFFAGLALLAKHYLKIPLSKVNLWKSSGMFTCTEWVTNFVEDSSDAMITPYQLYLKLKQSGDWRDSDGQSEVEKG